MSTGYIRYRSGYKYQLAEDYEIHTRIRPPQDIADDFISLDRQGNLKVSKGYAWDGVSGPVPDTSSNLRASLIHDALYQLMRKRKLSASAHRDSADQLFRDICREDGVPSLIA